VACIRAQTPQAPALADQEWANVLNVAKPTPLTKSVDGSVRKAADVQSEIMQQAVRSREAAQRARQFYLQNPSHPKAAEARKLEALSAIRGVQTGNTSQEQSAVALAKAYRDNRSVPATDRFDVALALDRFELSLKTKARTVPDRPEEWIKVADKLRVEFGELPALYTYYIDIARNADLGIATELARKVVQSSIASAASKAEAQKILDRSALLGKPLPLRVTNVDGGEVNLGEQRDKITLVIAWASSAASLEPLKKFAGSLPGNAQVIYVALGGTINRVRSARDALPLPGLNCYAGTGGAVKDAAETLKIKYQKLPYIYVIDRSANIVALGTAQELPILLARAVK
jgi:hypothetical protein